MPEIVAETTGRRLFEEPRLMARRLGDEFENSDAFLEIQGALSRRLKRLREERQLSQRQLAAIANVSPPHLGLIEAGVGNVTLVFLAKIAKALGVTVGDLFEGGSTRGAMDGAIVRLQASVEKIDRHMTHRRDEYSRVIDLFNEFLKEYEEKEREREALLEDPRPTRGAAERKAQAAPRPSRRKPAKEEG